MAAMTSARRMRLLPSLTFSIVVSLIAAASGGAQPGQGVSDFALTILHTNDLHSHNEPFLDGKRSVGGMARIAHLVRGLKGRNANVLTVDAGDIFQGTSFFKLYHGETDVAMLNLVGYDIYTIGNHEFDEGPDNLARQLGNAKFAVISANLDASANPTLAALVKPSVVKTIGGERVGFVGAITPELVAMSLKTGGVTVKGVSETLHPRGPDEQPEPGPRAAARRLSSEWLEPIRQEVEKLTAQGINKIILVTHVGVDLDRQLAESISDVDAIIGGHSHTRLSRPILVSRKDGSHALIVQTGCYGRALGKTDLSFDGNGRLNVGASRYSLINITDRIPEAEDVKAYLNERAAPIRQLQNKVAGVALGEFDNRFSRFPGDSPVGDLICDALADAGTKYGATIAFQNRGGIRSKINTGLITLENIEQVLPFDNHLTLATVDGETILKALEYSVSGSKGARFLDVHGLKFAYDQDAEPGKRLVFVLTRDKSGHWRELSATGKYKIAINDFTFAGGEGYRFSGATDVEKSDTRISKILETYMIKSPKLSPAKPSRIAAVHGGAIKLERRAGRVYLVVESPEKPAALTVFLGDGPGVEPVSGTIPVPLRNPLPAAGVKIRPLTAPDHPFVYEIEIPKRTGGAAREGKAPGWACVVITPQKPRAAADSIVTTPVRID